MPKTQASEQPEYSREWCWLWEEWNVNTTSSINSRKTSKEIFKEIAKRREKTQRKNGLEYLKIE